MSTTPAASNSWALTEIESRLSKIHLDSISLDTLKSDGPKILGKSLIALIAARGCYQFYKAASVFCRVWCHDARILDSGDQPRTSRKDRDLALKKSGPTHLKNFLGENAPDVIIIGSGIGGLTCAALCGRAGLRVLVLEQHDIAGGCLHTYTVHGKQGYNGQGYTYEWDVGIHYVGEMGTTTPQGAMLKQITRGQLEWVKQKNPYDVAYVMKGAKGNGKSEGIDSQFETRLGFVKGSRNNEENLCKYFQESAKVTEDNHIEPIHLHKSIPSIINSFYSDVRAFGVQSILLALPKIVMEDFPKFGGLTYVFMKKIGLPLLDFVSRGFYRKMNISLGDMLDEKIEKFSGIQKIDDKWPGWAKTLKLSLSYCWGDIGAEPKRLSYGMYLGLNAHFVSNGSYYPRGGAGSISYALVETIRKQNQGSTKSDVLVRCPVKKVIIENNKAIGVLVGSSTKEPTEVRVKPGGYVVGACGYRKMVEEFLGGDEDQEISDFDVTASQAFTDAEAGVGVDVDNRVGYSGSVSEYATVASTQTTPRVSKSTRASSQPLVGLSNQPDPLLTPGIAAFSLFVGLENDPHELGVADLQWNAWAYRTNDVDRDFKHYMSMSREEVLGATSAGVTSSNDNGNGNPIPMVFIGFPSNKNKESHEQDFGKNNITMTIITFVNYSWFADWQDTKIHKRGAAYETVKSFLADRMWDFTTEVYPQLKKAQIRHFEAGSPLSNNYYIGSKVGEIYGADHTASRFSMENMLRSTPSAFERVPGGVFGNFKFGRDAESGMTGKGKSDKSNKSLKPISNLIIAGQDTFCAGFVGGLLGGVQGAGAVLGSQTGMWLGMMWAGLRYEGVLGIDSSV